MAQRNIFEETLTCHVQLLCYRKLEDNKMTKKQIKEKGSEVGVVLLYLGLTTLLGITFLGLLNFTINTLTAG